MGQDEFFSFGDEEFGDPADSARPSEPGSSANGDGMTGPSLVVADPPPEKGACRSRGDSTMSSSEKRTPPSGRARLAAVGGLAVVVALLLRALLAAHGATVPTSDQHVVEQPNGQAGLRDPARDTASAGARSQSRPGLQPSGDHPRLIRHRGKQSTPHRGAGASSPSTRRRGHSGSGRTSHGVQPIHEPTYEPAYEPPPATSAPAPVVPPPSTEAAPAGGGIHSGANSPEFGL
jgi:hypothetical protein